MDLWMLFPNGLAKALTLSYDDGVEQDVRLIEIMNQHGLKGTFNINSGRFAAEGTVYPAGHIHRPMTEKKVLETYASSGQEVAIHARYHGDLPTIQPAHGVWQVMRDKEALENLFGRVIRGMAYPYGTTNAQVADTLRACGIAYSRTTEATCRFDLPEDWLRLPSTCHHNHPQLMELAQKFADMKPYRAQLFYLWGHSYEFERDDNWQVIEQFAKFIGGREDIWYATNIEVFDYITAWNRLQISADGRRMYNPSVQPLWFRRNGQVYCIKGGEELVTE